MHSLHETDVIKLSNYFKNKYYATLKILKYYLRDFMITFLQQNRQHVILVPTIYDFVLGTPKI